MIGDIDDVLLERLAGGLSLGKDDVGLGPATGKKRAVTIACSDFTVEDAAVGGSTSVKYEEFAEAFDADGAGAVYRVSKPPARAVLSVECPPGKVLKEGDDFVVELSGGIVRLRAVPKKAKQAVRIKYTIPRAIGESQNVPLALTYAITVKDGDIRKREDMAMDIVRLFYREKRLLVDRGIEDIQVVKGYGNGSEGTPPDEVTLVYRVLTTMRVDVVTVGPLDKIELDRVRVK